MDEQLRSAGGGRWALPPERTGQAAPESLIERRIAAETKPLPQLPAGVRCDDRAVGDIDCVEVERGESACDLVWFHGGGYRAGTPRTSMAFASELTALTPVRVLLPRYRLAPEYPFPAALYDALSVYKALLASGRPVLVGGDSAGGGLAVAMLTACAENQLAAPMGAVAISPWVDLTVSAPTYETNQHTDQFFSAQRATEARELYLQGADPRAHLISPVFGDLSGLPPMLLFVGGREVLLDDTLALGRALAHARIPVEMHVEAEMQHIWPILEPELVESARAINATAAFIERCVSQGTRKPAG